MDLGLKDKVAVVTGASRGLGKAIAHAFATEGAKLAICSRTEAVIQEVASDISKRYKTAVHREACNLLEPGATQAFIERAIRRFGHVDVLVNNLGAGLSRPFDEVSEDDWQGVMDINLKAAVRCCKAILPAMKERGKGKIINIAALSGRVPRLGQIASNVAKAALINFTESLACEVAPYGIRVNAICPAAVLTERWEERVNKAAEARGEDFPTAMRNMAQKFIPVGRFGAPEEVASAVVFLGSEKVDFITGACLMVDGGIGKAVSISME